MDTNRYCFVAVALAIVGSIQFVAFALVPVQVPQNLPAARRASLAVQKAGLDDWYANSFAKVSAHTSSEANP
jgi:hypothetical protein